MAKDFFKKNNVSYEDFNVAADLEKEKRWWKKAVRWASP